MHLCFMESANQRGKNVACLEVIVIPRPVDCGRHRADVLRAMLPVVRPAHFNASNLGDRIRSTGWFERPGEQAILAYRLGAIARINARRTKKNQSLHTGTPSFVDYVCLYC